MPSSIILQMRVRARHWSVSIRGVRLFLRWAKIELLSSRIGLFKWSYMAGQTQQSTVSLQMRRLFSKEVPRSTSNSMHPRTFVRLSLITGFHLWMVSLESGLYLFKCKCRGTQEWWIVSSLIAHQTGLMGEFFHPIWSR